MDCSSLFEISLHRLDSNTIDKLFETLLPLSQKKKLIENNFSARREKLDKEIKITYKEDIFKKQIKGLRIEIDNDLELKTALDAKASAIKSARAVNEFNDYKLVINSRSLCNIVNTKETNKSINVVNRDLLFQKRLGLKSGTKKLKIGTKEFKRRLLSEATTFITNKSNLYTAESQEPIDRKINVASQKSSTLDLRSPTMHTTLLDSDKNTLKQSTLTMNEDVSLKNKIGKENFNIFKLFVGNILKEEEEKVNKEKQVIISKSIRNTVQQWKKLKKNKKLFYSTGNIVLPLLTNIQESL
jgi:hypothetical protein